MALFLSPWNFHLLIECVNSQWTSNFFIRLVDCLHALGNEQVADLLLRNGANPNAVERDGSGPLHRAAVKGNNIALFVFSRPKLWSITYSYRLPPSPGKTDEDYQNLGA